MFLLCELQTVFFFGVQEMKTSDFCYRMLKGTLQQMAAWIHSYIAAQDSVEGANSDLRVHAVFYAVCQALFYAVTFRHRELLESKKSE